MPTPFAYPTSMGGVALEPFAGIAAVKVDTDNFKDHGGALSALHGRNIDETINYSTLGLRAATTLHISNMVITPKVAAAWQHAFDDVTPMQPSPSRAQTSASTSPA
jgi:outer membrane autotransporter protein